MTKYMSVKRKAVVCGSLPDCIKSFTDFIKQNGLEEPVSANLEARLRLVRHKLRYKFAIHFCNYDFIGGPHEVVPPEKKLQLKEKASKCYSTVDFNLKRSKETLTCQFLMDIMKWDAMNVRENTWVLTERIFEEALSEAGFGQLNRATIPNYRARLPTPYNLTLKPEVKHAILNGQVK